MIKIIRRCQNSRLVEGFHPLFHESGVAPLFHPLSASFSQKNHFFGVFQVSVTVCLLSEYAPGSSWHVGKKKSIAPPIRKKVQLILWSLSLRYFQSFSLSPPENTLYIAPLPPQGGEGVGESGEDVTSLIWPKNHISFYSTFCFGAPERSFLLKSLLHCKVPND